MFCVDPLLGMTLALTAPAFTFLHVFLLLTELYALLPVLLRRSHYFLLALKSMDLVLYCLPPSCLSFSSLLILF